MVMTRDPVPDVPLGTLNHEASGTAVHGQLACVVSVAVTLPAGMHGLNSTGPTEYWHAARFPPCRMVNLRSATAIWATRSLVSPFAATVYDTVPLPVPCAPVVTISHDSALTAVQAHSAGALTVNVRAPPSFPKDELSGSRASGRTTGGRPCCVTAWP